MRASLPALSALCGARAEQPIDTNDDFCFRCGTGGDLMLCDKCDRSYHMHCLDPPMETPPEGDWFCPAHTGRRSRGKDLAMPADAAEQALRNVDGGMRHKPPRVDASRYQVAPPAQLAGAARSAERARAEAAGSCMWCPARIGDDDLLELLGFARRLAHNRFRSDAFFNELVMTHLHLCDYNRVVAGHALLRASEKLAALPTAAWEELQADGHAEGDVIVALLRDAHGAARLMRGAPPGMLAVSLPAAARGTTLAALCDGDEGEMGRRLASHGDAEWEARREAIGTWEAEVGAAAATAEGLRLEQLQKLLADGAAAHGVDLAYVSAAQPRTAALHRLKGQVAEAEGWHAR